MTYQHSSGTLFLLFCVCGLNQSFLKYMNSCTVKFATVITSALLCITTVGATSLELATQHLNLNGEWQQGGVVRGHADSNIQQLRLNDKPLAIHANGNFIFAFARKATPNNTLSYRYNDKDYQVGFQLKRRQYQTQRINNLPKDKVTVPKKQLERIYSEYAMARKARASMRSLDYFSQNFILPMRGIITGVYGSQRILNGKPRRPHFGIDIAAATGTIVRAPAAGVVEMTHNDMYFSGATLILNHGLGVSSTFLHLHRILVQEGQVVRQGQAIAEVGATGRVTGAHLDWRMNWHEVRFDPMLILSAENRKILQSGP